MPELPEVTTTVLGLSRVLPGQTIHDVWSDYHVRSTHKSKLSIKNKKYFERFRKEIVGEKVTSVDRRGKNILIRLTHGKTILVHMKMTGHFLYGAYAKASKNSKWTWEASEDGPLQDPFNKFIHLIFTLSSGKSLAFSDMRKFAKVILFETDAEKSLTDLNLGPEPLEKLTLTEFRSLLIGRSSGKIKSVLMDQKVVAGIGNIYSDEILWEAGVHPEKIVSALSPRDTLAIWKAMIKILKKSISLGGDSMSDYRNIHGERGGFQNIHKVYRRAKKHCLKKGCSGIIVRKIIGGRSAHFCPIHQKL